MTVSDDRLGLADSGRDLTARGDGAPPGFPARPRRPLPVPPPADPTDLPRYLRATALLADADELDSAYAASEVAAGAATAWGEPGALAAVYSLRGAVSRRRGDLPAAEGDGRTAAKLLAAAAADPRGDAAAVLLVRRIAVLLDLGDVEEADALLAEFGDEPPERAGAVAFRYVRGRLHAAAGRPGEALADLFHCGERLAARRADRPAVLPWRSAAALILARSGAGESATRLVEAEVQLCRQASRASAMSRPSALGRALRIQGTVLGAPAGIPVLEEAV